MKRVLSSIFLALVAILLLLEVVIRSQPRLFGDDLGNFVFSRYGVELEAMYFWDEPFQIRLMRPDYEVRTYYNGYFWTHQTDSLGFRNLPGSEKRVLLIGDSMIYGHGVELEDTVSEVLRGRYGWHSYSLSQQGDCLYHSYLKLRLHLDELAPDRVILFYYLNDPSDLEIYRSTELIEAAPELTRDDYETRRSEILAHGEARPPALPAAILRVPSFRLIVGSVKALIKRVTRRSAAGPAGAPPVPTMRDPVRFERVERYYDRILADLSARTSRIGAELVLVNSDFYKADDEPERSEVREMLRSLARRHGITFLDTGDLITTCDGCQLPHDGHLSSEGHALLAEFLVEALDTPPSP